jgi:hypothetical protein
LEDGLEYALGGNPLIPSLLPQPQITIQTLNVGAVPDEYLTVSFRRIFDPGDVTYEVQFTDDLATWTANGVLFSSVIHGDGTVTELWRSAAPVAVAKHFARLKVLFK